MKFFGRDIAVTTEENDKPTRGNGHTDPAADPSVPHPPESFLHPRLTTQELIGQLKERKVWVAGLAGLLAIGVGSYIFFKGKARPAMPANAGIPVTVQTLVEKPVRLWSEFSARMQAVNYAEIRPEVSGRITQVRFEDGQTVKKGDVLFVIDPGPYQAALDKAEANAAFAKTEVERAGGLLKAEAIAQRQYDERQNANLVAQAEVDRARIDVGRAYVKAPFSGRVGRPEITVGNLVESGSSAPLLTSIVSNDGIYADFEVDEQTYLQTIHDSAKGRDQERAIPVELTVQSDKERVYKGTVYSFDNHLNTVSGTIRARARFDNKDGALMPGMFVSVKLGSSGETPAILVPEHAIGIDQNKKFVYVVGADNKVAYHEVTLGKSLGSDRVALSGLKAGDRVIIDGIQHVHPEALVAPSEAAPRPADPVVATAAP